MNGNWKLLLDQNIRIEVKDSLLEKGISVLHASDVFLQKASDPEVLQYATTHNCSLVTRDTDFGDFAIFPLPQNHTGVIRLKIVSPLPERVVNVLLPFLLRHKQEDINNSLVILTENKVRIKRSLKG